ncbi:MAG: hypothetical protein WCH01_07020 [Methylococcaceae bacterium]
MLAISDNKTANAASILFLIAAFFITASKLHLRGVDDDQYFLHALDSTGLYDYLTQRYLTWTGRISLELVMVTTITHEYFWRIAIPACTIITAYCLYRLVGKDLGLSSTQGATLVCLLIYIMDSSVYSDAAMWVTGFYVYLLPVSAALLSVYIIKESYAYFAFLISTVLMCYAVANEQIALCFILYSVITFISFLAKRKCDFKLLAFILIVMGFASFYLTAPGNGARFIWEKHNLLEFTNFNILDKATNGLVIFVNHVLSGKNYMMFLICSFFTIKGVVSHSKCNDAAMLTSAFLTGIYCALFILNSSIGIDGVFINDSNTFMDIHQIFKLGIYIKVVVTLMIFISLLYIAIHEDGSDAMLYTCLMFLVVSTSSMIGLSAAVWANRPRIFFIPDILLILFFLRFLFKMKLIAKAPRMALILSNK